jgi:4-hydroxybenzoate polyprenyltransferase
MRPGQWLKNGFVLAPLVFSGSFTDIPSLYSALTATFLFCLASSAIYILNDYHDFEADRQHPTKSKSRPLASGEVSRKQAIYLFIVLIVLLSSGVSLQPQVMVVIASYIALNVAYTLVLKHQPVIDIFSIATGFAMRVYAGVVAISVPISYWMFITTFCLALYLAAIKRRQELKQAGIGGRQVLNHYSIELADRYAEMSATCAVLFYSLFVLTDRPEMIFTIPFVLYGIFRYWYVVDSKGAGASPTEALLSDWQLALTIIIWIIISMQATWPTGVYHGY